MTSKKYKQKLICQNNKQIKIFKIREQKHANNMRIIICNSILKSLSDN